MAFNPEYEARLGQLKLQFLSRQQCAYLEQTRLADPAAMQTRIQRLDHEYARQLVALKDWVREHFDSFDARAVSSLVAVPTRVLSAQERIVHRIWLGGALPVLARRAMAQWNEALDEIERGLPAPFRHWRNWLWVWDAAQLKTDPRFVPISTGDARVIGGYQLNDRLYEVRSLQVLLARALPAHAELLSGLNEGGYYVNLSDIGRQLILKAWGGIYMDADTIPHRSATRFLCKPELPDYLAVRGGESTGFSLHEHVSWLNLYRDENGILVAKKDNPALAQIAQDIEQNLRGLPAGRPPARGAIARAAGAHGGGSGEARVDEYAQRLHAATYGAWQRHIGRTLLAHEEMAQRYSILQDNTPEKLVAGLQGLRLQADALTNEARPLDAAETRSRHRCLEILQARGWRLTYPRQLETVATLVHLTEIPRMAYPPQLRSTVENCHYYSFLSTDPQLDRINELFAAYLIDLNAEEMRRPGYWQPVHGERVPQALVDAAEPEHQAPEWV